MNPSDYNTNRRNFISAAEARLKEKFVGQAKADAFMMKVDSIANAVKVLARPIQQAGGAAKPDDRENLKALVLKWTMERVMSLDKETVNLIATTFLAQSIMTDIEADPWGRGKPEELSGL